MTEAIQVKYIGLDGLTAHRPVKTI